MRLVKVDRPKPNKVYWPAQILATVLLDLRNLCSNIPNYKPKSNLSIKIYNHLKAKNKTHLFNVTNFDPNLLEQLRQAMRFRSSKLSYLTYNHLERLETEQYLVLKKFGIPTYPENEELAFEHYIANLITKKLNGEKNGSVKKFEWE
jgi:hypothetical protein